MLAHMPHQERTEAAKQVIRLGQRVQGGWSRFLLAWACALQLVFASILALAPWDQLLTSGTRPVLDMASRYLWAVLYLVSGALTASTPWMRPIGRAFSWIAVMGLGGVWLTAFAVNVFTGGGSALGLAAWAFLYIPITAVAAHQSLRKR